MSSLTLINSDVFDSDPGRVHDLHSKGFDGSLKSKMFLDCGICKVQLVDTVLIDWPMKNMSSFLL